MAGPWPPLPGEHPVQVEFLERSKSRGDRVPRGGGQIDGIRHLAHDLQHLAHPQRKPGTADVLLPADQQQDAQEERPVGLLQHLVSLLQRLAGDPGEAGMVQSVVPGAIAAVPA